MKPFKWTVGSLTASILVTAVIVVSLKLYPKLQPYTGLIITAAIFLAIAVLGSVPLFFQKNIHLQRAYEGLRRDQEKDRRIETIMPRTVTGWRFRCDGEMHTIYDQAKAERWARQGFDVVQVEVPMHLAGQAGQHRM